MYQQQWDMQSMYPAMNSQPSPYMQQQPMMQQPMMPPMQQQQPMMEQPPFFLAPQPQLQQQFPQVPGMLPMEQSYIENILRLNRGKSVRVYMTFENNPDWPAKVFTGHVEEAGRDHIILHDDVAGNYYLLLMVNLDYVEFDEPINYEYPYNGVTPLAEYSPRD
ncbi:spore coat protein GerQ [Alkalihalobacillus sp. BA299]|uniref:spore coat protein GerQ n=1 Tax=Alkalihalobacillus sp. BA299 TaxID=2815938 RepID=UPI001ADB24FD|nr:spore coat protein GerQ [Alkalihalobacillus sp. BA299]